MAKMIPSCISPDIKSNAEKRIFEWLKNDPLTKDWIVLHSLGISKHRTVIHGETDFFVLAPYKGVFALEVKGGRISRQNGQWIFTNKYNETTTKTRGPFDQAWEGIHSIIDDIKSKTDSKHKKVKKIFFGIGVMFPDVEYNTIGCDEEQWQVFDVRDGSKVGEYINRLFSGALDKWKKLYNREPSFEMFPTDEDIHYIADLLRGDFDKAVSISANIRDSEIELIELTKEQYRCIDQIDDNPRCLIIGGAGTGKTLLALEEVKKAVSLGLNVALFCFNKNLGKWLEHYFDRVPPSLKPNYVGTFHKYMLQTLSKNDADLNLIDFNNNEVYSVVLPKLLTNNQNDIMQFDKIVIDEAQDLICEEYISVFDSILKKGIKSGLWTFFGDFSNQMIFNTKLTSKEMLELLDNNSTFTRFKLNVNCRNTKPICNEISALTGFEQPNEIWSKVNGLPVQYYTYSSREEEKKVLTNVLDTLLNNHVSPQSITILSPKKREKSIVNDMTNFPIIDYDVSNHNNISFCTIHSYKGLENTVIIITDIESISDKKLMYVALSRARSALYFIESEEARNEYINLMIRRLTNG